MVVHLTDEQGGELDASTLAEKIPNLTTVQIADPRFHRLNFDAITGVIVDLPVEFLLDSPGRRLVDVLGRLAQEELTLILFGPRVVSAGAYLEDGRTAGLNLVPHTIVLADVRHVADLRSLLAMASEAGLRLLAMEGEVGVLYRYEDDTIQVLGQGNAVLAGFPRATQDAKPAARLHVLRPNMRSGWPT
jgi:hypothetical protein